MKHASFSKTLKKVTLATYLILVLVGIILVVVFKSAQTQEIIEEATITPHQTVYAPNEELKFTFGIKNSPPLSLLLKRVAYADYNNNYRDWDMTISPSLVHADTGRVYEADFMFEKESPDTYSISVENPENSLAPGRYSLELDVTKGQSKKTFSQDFTWGVLVINPNKSVYSIGDTANLALAVLDEQGEMVCDATLELEIENPGGTKTFKTTKEGTIIANPECNSKELVTVPDFETQIPTNNIGTYNLKLKAVTPNGEYTIRDSFEVQESVPYDVERITATRIFPGNIYPVILRIKATASAKVSIEEIVPNDFDTNNLEDTLFTKFTGLTAKKHIDPTIINEESLIWEMDLEKDETYYIGYSYDAPDISPEFYTLGPLTITSDNKSLSSGLQRFTEIRKWQIAIDGTSDIKIAKGTFTSPASTGNDPITGVGFQPKAILVYGTLRTDESWGTNANHFVGFSDGTTHKSNSIKADDGANDQGRYSNNFLIELRDIGTGQNLAATLSSFDSDGFTINYTAASSGYIVHYVAFGGADLEAEVGEEPVSSSPLTLTSGTLAPDMMFISTNGVTTPNSEDTNAIFSFGVVDSDSSWYIAPYHGANNSNSNGVLRTEGCAAQQNNGTLDWEMTSCTLTATGMTWTGSNADEFHYLALDLGDNDAVVDTFSKETTGVSDASQDITGWGFNKAAAAVGFASAADTSTTISSDYTVSHGVFDGTNQGTMAIAGPNGSNAADSYQNDDNAIAIPTTTPSTTAGGTASDLDTDGVTLTWNPNDTTAYLIGYWAIEGDNAPPASPTLHDSPFDNIETYDATPSFEFTASDPDGTSDIIYQIEWDDNTAFSSPTTKTSGTDSGFENTVDGGDSSPFTEGERARFTIQSGDALSNSAANTAYYWRVRAIDPESTGGSGVYGDWSSTLSLRVNTSLKIERWLQTTDEQFDTGTLSDTVTSGSDNVLLGAGTTTVTYTGDGTFVIPTGITSITVKTWGAGGGGGAGGTSGVGGAGGGGGFAQATLTVTPSETIDVTVGVGGGAGTFPGSFSGGGAGAGGRSAVERTGTPLLIASGGGGGGGGDNSSSTAGGAGGAGGDTTGGATGGTSGAATGGGGGTSSAGGAGGTGGRNDGSAGASESGGAGADGRNSQGADGGANNGGAPNGGDGGTGNVSNGYGGGGGGGDGYYGGGGGAGSQANSAGGGGGGGGSSYTTGTGTDSQSGSGTTPGNNTDDDYSGSVGVGGNGGATSSAGSAGNDGSVIIQYAGSVSSGNITSTAVDYDWVSNMSAWKEFDWTETETDGTVDVSLYYNGGSDCDTIVPNAALSGNESGFSGGPIDISGLNTVTYNRLCLRADLAETTDTPYLEDWYISWAFNVAGTVYLANKTTQATTGNGGQCDSSTSNLTLRIDGTSPLTTTCSSSNGSYTFAGVEAAPGDTITIYSTDGTDKSNRAYVSDGGEDSNQDLYKDATAIGLDLSDGTMDILEMLDYDNDQNSTDMLFDADDATPDTIVWEAGTELYIPATSIFVPNGNANGHDIEIDGLWQASSGETINIDGSFLQDAGGTFTASTSTLTFDATSGTESLTMDGTGDLYNLVIDDGGGGSLTAQLGSDITVDNDLTITDGTLSSNGSDIYLGGDWTNNDTFSEGTDTVYLSEGQSVSLDSGCADADTCTNENFYNLVIEKGLGGDLVTLTSTDLRVTNTLTIAAGELIQGALNLRAEGSTAVQLYDFGRWTNLSTGNITLGGDVINDYGAITLNSNGAACGDADSIQIRSTAAAQRSWSGGGAFRMTDVDVEYQTGSTDTFAASSSNTGNNGANWLFTGCADMFNFEGVNLERLDLN